MKSKNIYSLPFKKNTLFLAVSDPRVHYSHWKHAIDFSIDLNIPILASLEGEIVDVKDDSTEGGNNEKYANIKYQNYITLKHANNEFSQYIHLAHKSSLVKIGDKVKRGDPISKGIAMIGYTTAPHLHIMVCIEKNSGYETLEIQFDKEIKIIRTPEEYNKELAKSKYRKLKKLEEKYHGS